MPKNTRNPRPSSAQITPQIQAVLDKWTTFAQSNGLQFYPATDINFKAKVVVEYNGACPCKRYERPICPCKECLPEIKRDGFCFCHIFYRPAVM